MRAAAIACAILPLLAAGCLGASAFPTSSDRSLGFADRAALAWNPDARLLAMTAIDPGAPAMAKVEEELAGAEEELAKGREAGTLEEGEENGLQARIAMLRAVLAGGPSEPGDGLAPAWMHLYEADGHGFVAIVGSSGVVDARETSLDAGAWDEDLTGKPLTGWKLDSVAAARAAAEVDETYAALQQDPNATAYAALVQDSDEEGEDGEGGGPLWLLAIESPDGGGAFVFVDAVDGTAVSLTDLVFGLFGTRERGSEDGTFAAAVDAVAKTSFTLQRPHDELAVRLEVTPPPVLPVEVTLTTPDGQVHDWEVRSEAEVPVKEAIVVADPVAGDYIVEITAPLAPNAQWELSWCTDGTDAIWFPTWEFPWAETACSDLG